MRDETRQVVIYLGDPRGQLIQTTLGTWRCYWRALGWRILDRPPEMDLGMPARPGDQQGLL